MAKSFWEKLFIHTAKAIGQSLKSGKQEPVVPRKPIGLPVNKTVTNSKQTADTTNRNYRNADIRRWNANSDILGYEIIRSNQCNPDCEICKAGAGKYSKKFNWSGWHVGCKCFIVPILPSDDDFMDKLVDGKRLKGYIRGIPSTLKTYVKNNISDICTHEWYVDNESFFVTKIK